MDRFDELYCKFFSKKKKSWDNIYYSIIPGLVQLNKVEKIVFLQKQKDETLQALFVYALSYERLEICDIIKTIVSERELKSNKP